MSKLAVMHFGHIEIFVKDPLAAKDFYVNVLGFKLESIPGELYVWLSLKKQSILLRPGKNNHIIDIYDESKCALVFYTKALEAKRRELESKGLEFKDFDPFEGCLTFTDPDGNWFQLNRSK